MIPFALIFLKWGSSYSCLKSSSSISSKPKSLSSRISVKYQVSQCHYLKQYFATKILCEISSKSKLKASETVRIGSFWHSEVTQIDFMKNMSVRKIVNFSHCNLFTSLFGTVWNFEKNSSSQILREINFADS